MTMRVCRGVCLYAPLLIVLLLCDLVTRASGVRYFYFCDITSNPVVQLHYDSEQEEYSEYSISGERHLRSNMDSYAQEKQSFEEEVSLDESDFVPAFMTVSHSQQRALDENNGSHNSTVQGRVCACADDNLFPEFKYYCPSDKSHCALSVERFIPPACLNISNNDIFSRSIFPILLIWYGLAFIFCVCTIPGRHAAMHCVGFLSPCWNNRRVVGMIQNNPAQASAWVRQVFLHSLAVRETIWNGGMIRPRIGEPIVMELKTKKFEAAQGDDSQHDERDPDANVCSICMGALEHHDRVGELECEHIFHVDCLKTWLKRRNVCPLCLRTNIAQVRPQSDGTAPRPPYDSEEDSTDSS